MSQSIFSKALAFATYLLGEETFLVNTRVCETKKYI